MSIVEVGGRKEGGMGRKDEDVCEAELRFIRVGGCRWHDGTVQEFVHVKSMMVVWWA